jgi:hypothetical protein
MSQDDLFQLDGEFLGSSSDDLVNELLKVFGRDAGAVRKVLEAAKAADYPESYIRKVIKNRKDLFNRDVLDQVQIDNWKPVKGQYPPIDYTHPRQPFYILSNLDRKKLYLDAERVEKLVNAERDRLFMS